MRHINWMALLLRHHGQHIFNPLHVFCRLKGLGLPSGQPGMSGMYTAIPGLCRSF